MAAIYEMLSPSGLEILSQDAVFVPPAYNDNSRKMQAQLPAVGLVTVGGMYCAGQPICVLGGTFGLRGTFSGVMVENSRKGGLAAVQFYGAAWVYSTETTSAANIGKFLTFDEVVDGAPISPTANGAIVTATCQYYRNNIGNITGVIGPHVYEVLLKSRCGQPEPPPVPNSTPLRMAQLSGGDGAPDSSVVAGTVVVNGRDATATGTLASGKVTMDGSIAAVELNTAFEVAMVSGAYSARVDGDKLYAELTNIDGSTLHITGTVKG